MVPDLVQVSNIAFLGWALLFLLLPLKWMAAVIGAALVHELFHAAAIWALKGRIRSIRIGTFGAELETEGIEGLREAVCAFAGPVGSFLLAAMMRRFPALGLCGLIQGIFNLVPVYPLDGGRALLRFLERLWPARADAIAWFIKLFVLFITASAALCLLIFSSAGLLPFVFLLTGMSKALLRKKP